MDVQGDHRRVKFIVNFLGTDEKKFLKERKLMKNSAG